jgi:hypothetical protein
VLRKPRRQLLVDPRSLPILDGTELDFVREGLNEGFKFNNPNAKAACGCGESFASDAGDPPSWPAADRRTGPAPRTAPAPAGGRHRPGHHQLAGRHGAQRCARVLPDAAGALLLPSVVRYGRGRHMVVGA